MSRRTRAWQLLLSASLLLGCHGSGCNPPTKSQLTDAILDEECNHKTKCPGGYECDFGSADPSNPNSLGTCTYVECGLTDICKQPQTKCGLPQETALCDKRNNDKYCECQIATSQEVPSTPTGGGTPTTGGPPTTGDKL